VSPSPIKNTWSRRGESEAKDAPDVKKLSAAGADPDGPPAACTACSAGNEKGEPIADSPVPANLGM
jgi:hypothetical protein